ncbi:calcium-activated potassium channel subunit beta-4-like [Actinia tenebrosa]|uniref:Calcium-activated potassium channel subunit beta-4-like n=1 Tax=Actinia tenebrosa TaxID=6105 RepID=A0A6P8ISQ3_ACTTE|nr:calcium-activated potassium channel subunit beta-4-like [Actinia tenebrosa]
MQSGFVVAPAIRQSICSRSLWTASRFYRCSAGIIFVSLILLILLGIFVVGPARDGLNLKPATCTVKSYQRGVSESCSCGKYCTSSFPCLKIYVDYQPEGKMTNVTDVLLHDTVYEHNDYIKCSTAPCERSEQINTDRVNDFQKRKGQVHQKYLCYYNIKKPDEVVTVTGDFKTVILHCILWPVLVIIIMIFLILGIFFYRKYQAAPKDGQDINLVWD